MNWQALLVMVLGGVLVSGVEGESAPRVEHTSFHFAHDISPILARYGCSAAECHGGATGKGGFKLSLFSSDPEADYAAITRELGARRIDFIEPDNSLFLKKPSRQIKHEGGRIFKTQDPAYVALVSWIESGAPWKVAGRRTLADLSIGLKGDTVQVLAVFESETGETVLRDVTGLSMFESTNEDVVEVDASGGIRRAGSGEAWILARYCNLSARVAVLTPFASEVKAPSTRSSELDRVWRARLAKLGLEPASRAEDPILVRRLYLDLVGRPPSPLEVRKFDGLPVADRVAETVDQLLEGKEFAANWAGHLSAWFEVPISERDPKNSQANHDRLRALFLTAMQSGVALDQLARQVFTEPGYQLAWKRFSDPRDRAEYVGRAMLGLRIDCARCHNHPLDRWRQEEHLQFSAYFSDPRPKPGGGGMIPGRFFEPETGREVAPALLPVGTRTAPEGLSREQALAWLIVESGAEQFARNFANRVFATLVGRPLVDAEDDHRLSNPAIHEALLDMLAKHLADSGYDLRSLVRSIATSYLYALSSEPTGGDDDPALLRYFGRRESRQMESEEFRAAVAFVCGTRLDQRRLPSPSPLSEQLYVLNSGLIQEALGQAGNQIDAIFDFGDDPQEQLDELFLQILARQPTAAEAKTFLPLLLDAGDRRTAGRDLAFALLAGREFGSVR